MSGKGSNGGYWWNENKEDLVFPNVNAVAVYVNTVGDVVIRQERLDGDDDDLIVVPILHIDALCKALQSAKELAEQEGEA